MQLHTISQAEFQFYSFINFQDITINGGNTDLTAYKIKNKRFLRRSYQTISPTFLAVNGIFLVSPQITWGSTMHCLFFGSTSSEDDTHAKVKVPEILCLTRIINISNIKQGPALWIKRNGFYMMQCYWLH